jgi:hypothetical protein
MPDDMQNQSTAVLDQSLIDELKSSISGHDQTSVSNDPQQLQAVRQDIERIVNEYIKKREALVQKEKDLLEKIKSGI